MSKELVTPWSSVGYITAKRTYARDLPNESGKEEWKDTVKRSVGACNTQLNVGYTKDEQDRLEYYMMMLKGTVAGRFLWQLGTSTVDRLGLASLQNCAFTVVDDPIRPFTWCMDMLALGSGVGYNIQRKHVDKLPAVKSWFKAPTRVDHGGADFIIPDSREGWVKFLGKTLKAAFLSSREENGTFTYSTQVVRGKGSAIKGFGGVASGPEDLCKGIAKISEIIMHRAGKKLRPIDCLDIMNIIGDIIVAGNVRRSAQIAIGDPDDVEFLLAKCWDLGNIPAWRGMSNNSVACDDINDLHEYFWTGYEGRGEPYGLINLRLTRSCGRLTETQYPDPAVEGYNPCAEQGLAPFETCSLAEIFLPNITSFEELLDLAILLYRANKHALALPCHHTETEDIVFANMRMGIGITGVMQATPEQIGWLDEVYKELRKFDIEYSLEHGFNPSIKLTTVKPSGTLSLLPGVTPGIHPGFAQYMIRRISMASDNALVEVCRKHGYPIEFQIQLDGSLNYNTVIVSFPFKYSGETILAKDMTALKQLEMIKKMQTVWSDNSVSCTVYYKPEELPAIKAYLAKNYRSYHKSLSFMLHKNHGFKQAPYEEITEEEYTALVSSTTPITGLTDADFEAFDECESGACPIR